MLPRVRDLLELCCVAIKALFLGGHVYIFTFYTAVQREGLGYLC